MQSDRELMQQALDALEYAEQNHGGDDCYLDTIEALRARLAQPERDYDIQAALKSDNWAIQAVAMAALHRKHTAPPQREFIGLTDEDWADFIKNNLPDEKYGHTRMRAVWEFSQAKLKEKNA